MQQEEESREGVQECNLKHFILTINFLFCLSLLQFFHFNLMLAREKNKRRKKSLQSLSVRLRNEIGFAFECEI